MVLERKNLLAVIEPQSGAPLLLDIVPFMWPTTAFTGVVATLQGSGGTAPYSYTLISGSIPPNTSFNGSTGQIVTTGPLSIGTSTFVVQVQDAASNVYSRAFSITVRSRLTAINADPTDASDLSAYNYQFLVVGATGTLSYTLITGTLPAGLTISSGGLLSGTLSVGTTTIVQYPLIFRASDSGSGESINLPCTLFLYPRVTGLSPQTPLAVALQPYLYEASQVPLRGKAPFTIVWDDTQWKENGVTVALPSYISLLANGDLLVNAPESVTAIGGLFTITDALGSFSQIVLSMRVTNIQQKLQLKKDGVNVGAINPINLDFTGDGVAVTTSSTTRTINVPAGAGVTATSPIVVTAGNITHANSGVTAGVYDRVTVNTTGHVTAGVQDWTTIYSRSISASLAYTSSDFVSMSASTDVVRLTGSAGGTAIVRGFYASATAGQTVFIRNASTTTVTFNNQDGTEPTAGARFDIGANFALAPGHGALAWYDGTSSRWTFIAVY